MNITHISFGENFFSSIVDNFVEDIDFSQKILADETSVLIVALKKNGGRIKPIAEELGVSEYKAFVRIREEGLTALADTLRKEKKRK